MNQLIGAHTSIQGGLSASIVLADKLNFSAMQIFTKNNNRWNAKEISISDADEFKSNLKLSKIKFVLAHDSYLINLCSSDSEQLKKSRLSFIDELNRCELLEIPYLNFHPGTYGKQNEEDGIKLIAESINFAHNETKNFNVKSMMETTAGQGTSIGFRFEQLKQIIDKVDDKNRLAVCIDTAHIFAAGYDIRTEKGFKKVIKEFDEIIGLNYLQCFHVNDSKKPLGSRVDRHEHIGKGLIGLEGFSFLMNEKKLSHIPKILETPKGKEQLEDLENISILKSLIKK